MPLMLITLDVSQPDMSSLKVASPKNRRDMSVTFPTHHEFIGEPYVSDTSQLLNDLPQSPSMYERIAD